MGHILFRIAVVTCALSCGTLPTFASEQLIDDFEDRTNANEFGGYWSYYDDNYGVKPDDRPQADPNTTPSVIQVPYTIHQREAFGDTSDTWPVKEYRFTTAEEHGNNFATMPFLFGEEWEASYGTATSYAGISTLLAPPDQLADLQDAGTISFKIRSHQKELAVVFKVVTADIEQDSSEAYYQKLITVTPEWATITVNLDYDDLAQPGWTPAAAERELAKDRVKQISWEVQGGSNYITGDTIDIDDVIIDNDYGIVPPPYLWTKSAPMGQEDGLFLNFEEPLYKDATRISTWLYAVSDESSGGSSIIETGATDSIGTDRLKLKFEENSGSDQRGYAPYIAFNLGKPIKEAGTTTTDSVTMQAFVGITVDLYDSSKATYFNATTGKKGIKGTSGSATGIYFEYLADGDFKYLTIELLDAFDVGDTADPARKDSRGTGIHYFRHLPKSSFYRAVSIPFSEFAIHNDWDGYREIPLDITRLARLQFKVQGSEGQTGILFIDNVCFPGCETFYPSGVNLRVPRFSGRDLTFSFCSGQIKVHWNDSRAVSGTIDLINTRGAVVASTFVKKNGSKDISASRIPAGFYFIQFRGIDEHNSSVSQCSAVTIVK